MLLVPSQRGYFWAINQPDILSIDNTVRYKIINGKKRPLCDYDGDCKNLAFKEVYPDLGKKNKNSGWSYLCRKHFKQEQKKFKRKLAYCGID